MLGSKNRRVLIIDDNPSIHDDFRKILGDSFHDVTPDVRETLLFGDSPAIGVDEPFEVDSAYQGEEGIKMVLRACQEGRPYALAFVDVRMPPGIDGIETIQKLWSLDADLQFVVCSAYCDHTARDILVLLGVSDRLLMLRKPCDSAEILLLSTSLCEKWTLLQSARTLQRSACVSADSAATN